MKLCRTCKLEKPVDDFYVNRSKNNQLSNQCKACAISYQKARYLENPDKVIANTKRWAQEHLSQIRDSKLKRQYGISSTDYQQMYNSQNGCCAICKEAHDLLDVDHCHTSGKVRGLLCRNCNHGLGKFKDSVEFLQAAIQYLS